MKRSLFVLPVVLAACSPTAPTPSAQVETRGELSITCNDATCRFTGTAVNIGTGCAADVTGATTFRAGTDERTVRVDVSPSIRAGESATFAGLLPRKVFVSLLPTQWRAETTFTWSDAKCWR